MLRRAFGRAFAGDEIEDIYSSAWLGTLRALERRQQGLDDEEIRKYVLTAVAHQASKELRRRRRRPTSPLDGAPEVPDNHATSPEERVASAEERGLARELLTTLPPRRRAVMMLRYGWGLEPRQVCGLVDGLSPRAYRKEITRGVDELTEKMRKVEAGDWCSDREPVLKAYAAGMADEDQARQAQHHLANCRDCADFVGRLAGHLHDLGGGAVVPIALSGGAGSRVGAFADRARDMFGGGGAGDAVTTVGSSGAARGSGTAGAGVLAKIASLGAGGKTIAACLAGGAAAATCVAVGVAPQLALSQRDSGAGNRPARARPVRVVVERSSAHAVPVTLQRPPVAAPEPGSPPPAPARPKDDPGAEPAPEQPASPVAPTAAPAETEFGVASAAQPASSGSSTSNTSSSSSSSGSSETSAVGSEFGP